MADERERMHKNGLAAVFVQMVLQKAYVKPVLALCDTTGLSHSWRLGNLGKRTHEKRTRGRIGCRINFDLDRRRPADMTGPTNDDLFSISYGNAVDVADHTLT